MTPERMRIVIAELTGELSTECPDCYGTGFGGSESDHLPCDTCNRSGEVQPYSKKPYTDDLNATHEMENTMSKDQRDAYYNILSSEASRVTTVEEGIYLYRVRLISATALQRCEAFIRTHGRWEESQ